MREELRRAPESGALDVAFAGRAGERSLFARALREASRGRGRMLLFSGEPGIGKTRLLDELVSRVRGARVLRGAGREGDGAPPLEAWIEMLGALRRADPRSWSAAAGAELDALLAGPAGGPAGEDAESGAERVGTAFEAIRRVLEAASRRRPLLLAIDDLHHADPATCRILHGIVRALRGARLLVVAAYRDPDPGCTAPLPAPLLELLHDPAVTRRTLHGFEADEIARVFRAVAGNVPSPGRLAAIRERTGGNPLFVIELARVLDASPAEPSLSEAALPETLRALIESRLARLSPRCQALLARAALLDREFDPALLAAAGELAPDDVRGGIEEALAARALVPVAGVAGALCFTHALFREALAGALPLGERRRFHARIATLLEPRPGVEPAELARHFAAAGGEVAARKALHHTRRAADRALASFAAEQAASLYRRALGLLDGCDPADDDQRSALLLGLGKAELRAGRSAEARAAFREAAVVARRGDHPERIVEVALGLAAGFSWFWGYGAGTVDELLVGLLEAALPAVGDDARRRALLLAQLGVALYWSDTERRARVPALIAEAEACARRAASPRVLASVLACRHWATWGPDDAGGRLRLAGEIAELARAAGSFELELVGHEYGFVDALEQGDVSRADRELDCYARLAAGAGRPSHRWYTAIFRATRALMQGRLTESARWLEEAAALGRDAASETVDLAVAGHLFALRREQDRVAELIAPLERFAERFPAMPAWRAGLACAEIDRGAPHAAAAQLAQLAAQVPASWPRDNLWLATLALAADAAADVGHVDLAGVLHDALAPFADRVAVAGVGFFAWGPVGLALGRLEIALGRHEQASLQLERALADALRMGAPLFTARAHLALAELHAGRDAASARQHAAAAAAIARELELPRIARLARRFVAADEGEDATAALFRRDGEYWTIRFRGELCRIRDTRGLRHLAQLVAAPGREFAAGELLALGGESRRAARGAAGAERARVTVTQRLHAALAKIRRLHPALGRHLDASLHTGRRCRYEPAPGDAVAWQV